MAACPEAVPYPRDGPKEPHSGRIQRKVRSMFQPPPRGGPCIGKSSAELPVKQIFFEKPFDSTIDLSRIRLDRLLQDTAEDELKAPSAPVLKPSALSKAASRFVLSGGRFPRESSPTILVKATTACSIGEEPTAAPAAPSEWASEPEAPTS